MQKRILALLKLSEAIYDLTFTHPLPHFNEPSPQGCRAELVAEAETRAGVGSARERTQCCHQATPDGRTVATSEGGDTPLRAQLVARERQPGVLEERGCQVHGV